MSSAVIAPRSSERDQLRNIVERQCLPHWQQSRDPAPCLSLSLVNPGRDVQGFAVLPDRKGGAHLLLIPTQDVDGIESAVLRDPGTLNYLDAAWQSRGILAAVVKRPLPRSAVGLAVNSIAARSQDQLHIHIQCLGVVVYEALNAQAAQLGPNWTVLNIAGRPYQALRILGERLGSADPFKLLAAHLDDASRDMGQYTLLVAGMDFSDGPGFAVLAGFHVPGAESLLDSSCSVLDELT